MNKYVYKTNQNNICYFNILQSLARCSEINRSSFGRTTMVSLVIDNLQDVYRWSILTENQKKTEKPRQRHVVWDEQDTGNRKITKTAPHYYLWAPLGFQRVICRDEDSEDVWPWLALKVQPWSDGCTSSVVPASWAALVVLHTTHKAQDLHIVKPTYTCDEHSLILFIVIYSKLSRRTKLTNQLYS